MMKSFEHFTHKEADSTIKHNDLNSAQESVFKENQGFWNDVFSSKEREAESLDKNMWEEIFNYQENDFDFNIESNELSDLIAKFDPENWAKYSDNEKVEIIENTMACLCENLGIEEKPLLRFFDDEEYICGGYNSFSNTLDINERILDNPIELVDTIAHETRHAYQYQRSLVSETATDKLYAFNFENYIAPEYIDGYCINYLNYQDQFIEVEARAFAEQITSREA